MGAAIKAGIRGMAGRARKTVTVEEVSRGKFLGNPIGPAKNARPTNSRRKVNRGLLRR